MKGINTSIFDFPTMKALFEGRRELFKGLGKPFGAPFDSIKPAKTNFKNLLAHLPSVSANGKYVVLIDEPLCEPADGNGLVCK